MSDRAYFYELQGPIPELGAVRLNQIAVMFEERLILITKRQGKVRSWNVPWEMNYLLRKYAAALTPIGDAPPADEIDVLAPGFQRAPVLTVWTNPNPPRKSRTRRPALVGMAGGAAEDRTGSHLPRAAKPELRGGMEPTGDRTPA